MPVVLLFIGLLLLASAVAGTTADLAGQLKTDLTGPGSFLYWVAALVIIGALGYVPGLGKVSKAFIALAVLSMFLANGTGIIAKFTAAVTSPGAADPITDKEVAAAPAASSSSGTGTSGVTQGVSGLLQAIPLLAAF